MKKSPRQNYQEPLTALVMDDEPSILDGITGICESLGFEVQAVNNIADACKRINDYQAFDFAILDKGVGGGGNLIGHRGGLEVASL